jgi:hypothetical protein
MKKKRVMIHYKPRYDIITSASMSASPNSRLALALVRREAQPRPNTVALCIILCSCRVNHLDLIPQVSS